MSAAALRRAWRRCVAWVRRDVAEAEMTREMAAHLALMTEALEREGLDPMAARRQARLRFGSLDAAQEHHRGARGLEWLDQFARDIRLALRSLRRAPAFTAAAVLTLALGLGATLAVFTVVNAVLLEPLPFPHAEELVALRQVAPGAGGITNGGDGFDLSLSMYVTYTEHNHSFQSMGVWVPGRASVTGRGQPEQVKFVQLTDGVLQTLEVPPQLGRWFGAADFAPHGIATVMLSWGYWQRKFGGVPGVVGQMLDVNDRPREIVGVMPRGFRLVDTAADLFLPIPIDRGTLHAAGFGYTGLARLRPGVSLESADADLARLLPVWMASWKNCPKCDSHFYQRWRITPALRPLKDDVVGGIRGVLWAVLGTIALLMLMAAGNVTNLFLVRGEARQHELAVRTALGAGRRQLARQLLVESGLLALAGCGLGLLLAAAAVAWLRAQGPENLPRLQDIALNARVLWAALGLAAMAALVAGLAPLWRRGGADPAPALASESRHASDSRARRRVRRGLAASQVALALLLLLAAGLLLRSVAALRQVSPGFTQPATVQTFQISIPPVMIATDQGVMRTENNILDRLAALPGVHAVGLADQAPLENNGEDWDIVVKQGMPFTPGSSPPVRWFSFISPRYLATLGTELMAGRDFTWADVYGLRHVVLVSDNLAQEFWGSARAAVGQQLSPSGPGNWYRVIGVVQDVRALGVDKPAPATVYWPALTGGLWGDSTLSQLRATFVIRTARAGSMGLQTEVRRVVAAVNPDLPVANYRTMEQIYDRSMAVPSFTMVVLGLAGLMALGLGLVGIYGVIAYDVAQRRREIGIRMALGSSRGAVRRLFVRQGLGLAFTGGLAGLAAGALAMQTLRSLLFRVSPLDPLTFVAAPCLLLAAVLLASYLPALRASRQETGQVLRD